MPPAANPDASLINDAEFFDELEQFQRGDEHNPNDADLEVRRYADAFDALERGLPMGNAAPHLEAPEHPHHYVPVDEPDEPALQAPAPTERQIPLVAAALVIALCLTAGAAAAAFVFHDRVAPLTALRPASR